MTQVINISEVKGKWNQILNKVFRNDVRVVVEKSGVPVGAIISAKDLEKLGKLERPEKHLALLDKAKTAASRSSRVAGVVRRTAGVFQINQPPLSAGDLRSKAEQAWAEDVLERTKD